MTANLVNQIFFAGTNLVATGYERDGGVGFLPNAYAHAVSYDALAVDGGGDEDFVKAAYKGLFEKAKVMA